MLPMMLKDELFLNRKSLDLNGTTVNVVWWKVVCRVKMLLNVCPYAVHSYIKLHSKQTYGTTDNIHNG